MFIDVLEQPDTDCPLCFQPLNGEQFFHLSCAQEENARADAVNLDDDTDDGEWNRWEV